MLLSLSYCFTEEFGFRISINWNFAISSVAIFFPRIAWCTTLMVSRLSFSEWWFYLIPGSFHQKRTNYCEKICEYISEGDIFLYIFSKGNPHSLWRDVFKVFFKWSFCSISQRFQSNLILETIYFGFRTWLLCTKCKITVYKKPVTIFLRLKVNVSQYKCFYGLFSMAT